jgi:hypothetical protein
MLDVTFASDSAPNHQSDIIEIIMHMSNSPDVRWTNISNRIIARGAELGYSITDATIHTVETIKAQKDAARGISIINPSSSENVTIWGSNNNYIINNMVVVVRGTSPSVTWTVKKSSDRSTAGTPVITAGTTTTSTTGTVITTMDSPSIVDGDFVWLEISATSGTVQEFHLTIYLGRASA